MSRITDHSDQCECAYHEECLEDLIPNAGDAFIYPKCRDTLDEVMHRRVGADSINSDLLLLGNDTLSLFGCWTRQCSLKAPCKVAL
jgi:hypothetical protein